ncbi:MAG: nucleotidyltransferase domain-containing protein [Candidatus Nezhaarchaeota archaeon]|nr:nucleotidyltransferase domain-containing protein [Candidatus Nezhaarchaeota archaeon]
MAASHEELGRVKLSKRQRKELLAFLRQLRERLDVSEVYFFGSRVYGAPLKDSDLDMVVVSERFRGRNFVENVELLNKLWNGSFTIEMFPYTPEQLKEYYGRKVVVTEALERGVKIDLRRLW